MAGGVAAGVGTIDPGSDIDSRFILGGISTVCQHTAVVSSVQTPEFVIIDMNMGHTGIAAVIRMTGVADLAAVEVLVVGRTDGFAGTDGDVAGAGRSPVPVMAGVTGQDGIGTGPAEGR